MARRHGASQGAPDAGSRCQPGMRYLANRTLTFPSQHDYTAPLALPLVHVPCTNGWEGNAGLVGTEPRVRRRGSIPGAMTAAQGAGPAGQPLILVVEDDAELLALLAF